VLPLRISQGFLLSYSPCPSFFHVSTASYVAFGCRTCTVKLSSDNVFSEQAPPAHAQSSCSDAGVLGAIPGLIGCLQAVEVVKVCGEMKGETLSNSLLFFDGISSRVKFHPFLFKLCSLPSPSLSPLSCFVCDSSSLTLQHAQFRRVHLKGRSTTCRVCGGTHAAL
jgi:hypothetical protein